MSVHKLHIVEDDDSVEPPEQPTTGTVPLMQLYPSETIARIRRKVTQPSRGTKPVDLARLKKEFFSSREGIHVKLRDLQVDLSYQRHSSPAERRKAEAQVVKYLRSFDSRAVGKIAIAKRDNRMVIVDGVHRALLAAAIGVDGLYVSDSFQSRSAVEESEVFESRNFQRRTVDRVTRHRSMVLRGQADALALDRACAAAGVTIQTGTNAGYCAAVDELLKTIRMDGAEALTRGLRLFRRIYPESNVTGTLATAFTFLVKVFPSLDEDRIVKVVGRNFAKPAALLKGAEGLPGNQRNGRHKARLVAELLTEKYNSRLGDENKLDDRLLAQTIRIS